MIDVTIVISRVEKDYDGVVLPSTNIIKLFVSDDEYKVFKHALSALPGVVARGEVIAVEMGDV